MVGKFVVTMFLPIIQFNLYSVKLQQQFPQDIIIIIIIIQSHRENPNNQITAYE